MITRYLHIVVIVTIVITFDHESLSLDLRTFTSLNWRETFVARELVSFFMSEVEEDFFELFKCAKDPLIQRMRCLTPTYVNNNCIVNRMLYLCAVLDMNLSSTIDIVSHERTKRARDSCYQN